MSVLAPFPWMIGNGASEIYGVFVFNTNLTFLHNIDIAGFEKFQQKIKLLPMGFELTTATNTGLEF